VKRPGKIIEEAQKARARLALSWLHGRISLHEAVDVRDGPALGLTQRCTPRSSRGISRLRSRVAWGGVGTFSYDYGIGPEFITQADYVLMDGTALACEAVSAPFFWRGFRSALGDVKIATWCFRRNTCFTPDAGPGCTPWAGGVCWWKDDGPRSHECRVGWPGGLGVHYEASERWPSLRKPPTTALRTNRTASGTFL